MASHVDRTYWSIGEHLSDIYQTPFDEGFWSGWGAMIRIRGDEETGYSTMVACDECQASLVFQPGDHGLWVGSARQVRIYLTDHKGWVWDAHSGAFYCPEHFH